MKISNNIICLQIAVALFFLAFLSSCLTNIPTKESLNGVWKIDSVEIYDAGKLATEKPKKLFVEFNKFGDMVVFDSNKIISASKIEVKKDEIKTNIEVDPITAESNFNFNSVFKVSLFTSKTFRLEYAYTTRFDTAKIEGFSGSSTKTLYCTRFINQLIKQQLAEKWAVERSNSQFGHEEDVKFLNKLADETSDKEQTSMVDVKDLIEKTKFDSINKTSSKEQRILLTEDELYKVYKNSVVSSLEETLNTNGLTSALPEDVIELFSRCSFNKLKKAFPEKFKSGSLPNQYDAKVKAKTVEIALECVNTYIYPYLNSSKNQKTLKKI